MQRRAAIWILSAFKTSSLKGIEAIAGLTPSNSTFKNQWADCNYTLFHYPPTISFEYLWNHLLALPSINILPHLMLSPVIKELSSKVTQLTQTIDSTEFSLPFLLFILNFLWVSELLTIFQIVFLLIYVIKKKMTKSTFNSLITWLLSCLSSHPQLLL